MAQSFFQSIGNIFKPQPQPQQINPRTMYTAPIGPTQGGAPLPSSQLPAHPTFYTPNFTPMTPQQQIKGLEKAIYGTPQPKPTPTPQPQPKPQTGSTNPYAKDPGYAVRFENLGFDSPERIAAYKNYLAGKTSSGTTAQQTISPEQQYIDQMYQPTLDFLDQQGGVLRDQYGQNQDYYGSLFDPQYGQLDAARQSGIAQNQFAQQQQGQQQQSAIDLASQTYGELTQRNQQQYGGSSSAGQFGNEFLGRELQRGIGQATSAAQENIGKLQMQLGEIESNYQTQKQGIDQQKNQALVQLQQAFEQALLQIDQQKASISGSKAADKYNALKEFNQHQQQIIDQSNTLAQQLGANAQSAQQQLQSALIQYAAQAGKTPDMNQISALTQGLSGNQYQQFLPEEMQVMQSPLAKKKQFALA